MGISASISRFKSYFARHGVVPTIRRAALSTKRALYANRMIVFYCDLAKHAMTPPDIPSSLKFERARTYAELSQQDLDGILNIWNRELADRNLKERFGKGACLWLIKCDGQLAGYGWTLRGSTMEPYFLRLAKDDPYLFDGFVLTQFRGRGLIQHLLNFLLHQEAIEGGARAFAETAEWNRSLMSAISKTPFRPLALARSFRIFGHTFIFWYDDDPAELMQKVMERRILVSTTPRTHER